MFSYFSKGASLVCLGLAASLLAGCAEPCNGRIESTVLYFAEAPSHQGQLVYVNVVNQPDLGVQHTLTREGKEFGTFPNIVIIEDRENKFKGRRSICFDEYTVHASPTAAPLNDEGLPQITLP